MTSRRRKPRSVRPRKRGKEAGTPRGFARHRTPNFERLETRCVLSASGSMIGDMDWDQDIDLDDVEYFALGLSNRAAYESHFGTSPDLAGDVDQDSRFDVDDVGHFVKLFQKPHPQPSRGSIHGVKWLDGNGNGQRDGDEPGVPGIVIYSDRNFNGSLDDGEPHTVTMADLPETDFDESGRYWLEELRPGLHAIREVLPGGFEQTFPGPNPEPAVIGNGSPHHGGAHVVQLGSGATVEGIDFGNRPIEPGSVHGLKWLDRNGNGQRDADEPGLPGVVIYSDRNFNGRLDRGEPHTRTMEDIPETDFDEAGMYWLEKLRPGLHAIREVLPDGFEQTFPSPNLILEGLDDGSLHRRGAHVVWVGSGVNVEGIDFGNRPIQAGSIHGLKWLDRNGNGQRDADEPGLAGVVIYSDRNFNGRLDRGEPHTRTMEDIPETDFDEAGMYWLEKLRPGRHVIREVVPDGFQQTFPAPILAIAGLDDGSPHRGGAHVVRLGWGATVEGIDFGNRPIEPGSIHGLKWLDRNGNGERDADEPGLAGVVIYSDRNFNGRLDRGEPHTRTMEDIPETDFDEAGMYWLEKLRPGRHVIREVVPDGFQQTFPAPILAIAGLDDGSPHRGGAHVVRLGWGATVEGIDFGNRPIEPGSIHGLKWLDRNGNGERDENEPGLAGVVIYSDRNFNGRLDRGEPHTRTMEDVPETDFDEAGMYWLEKLRPGRHVIREVVPDGFLQTFPAPILAIAGVDDGSPHRGGAHVVRLGWGEAVEGIDFGNRPIEPGSVHGLKWLDRNGNGERDADEPGLPGVVIYSDRNFNGRLDRGEPHTRTMEDVPETDFDEAGMYWLGELRPGRHVIREVVPEGFEQTFPARAAPSLVEVTDGEVAGDPDEFFSVSPREIHETVAAGEVFQTDVSLTVHPFCVRPFKVDVVASDPDVPFGNLTGVELNGCGGDTSTFHIQIVGDGRPHRFDIQFVDFEFGGVLARIPATIRADHDGGHLVVVTSGSAIEGIDFGNRERLVLPGDLNRDGQVQADDAEALLLSLVDPRSYEGLYGLPGNGNGDIDGDRVFDLDDIDEFSKLLFGRQPDEAVLAAALESVLEHDAPLGRLL